MAEAFDREQSFRTLSPEEGVKARDLAGRARKEHPPSFAQQRGGFCVTAVRIALHVFGFEQRLQFFLFFCLAVRYPSPRRDEGRAEYDASFAQRPPPEEPAARAASSRLRAAKSRSGSCGAEGCSPGQMRSHRPHPVQASASATG